MGLNFIGHGISWGRIRSVKDRGFEWIEGSTMTTSDRPCPGLSSPDF